MPAVLARAIVAFTNLVRQAETRQQDRTRLRAAAEEAALVLLQQLRTGDRAEIDGIVYEAEQVTLAEPTAGTPEGEADRHGARALLRDNRVLVVAERAERGRGPSRARPKPIGAQQLARRQLARPGERSTVARVTDRLCEDGRWRLAQEVRIADRRDGQPPKRAGASSCTDHRASPP